MLTEPKRTDRKDVVGGAALDEITHFIFGDFRMVFCGKGNRPFHASSLLGIAEIESRLFPEFKSVDGQRRVGGGMDFGGDQRAIVRELSHHFGQESGMVIGPDERDPVFTVTDVQRRQSTRSTGCEDGPQVGEALLVWCVLKIGQWHDVEKSWTNVLGSCG